MPGGGHREWDIDCKVFIGGLRDDANRYDIEDVFSKYGPVRDVWVARKPPGFAFVEMEDPRDAKDAVKSLDGTRICGARVRVEMSEPGKRRGKGGGGRRSRSRSRSPRRRRSPSYDRRRSNSRDNRRRRSPSYERKKSASRDDRRSRSNDRGDSSYKREERSKSRS